MSRWSIYIRPLAIMGRRIIGELRNIYKIWVLSNECITEAQSYTTSIDLYLNDRFFR